MSKITAEETKKREVETLTVGELVEQLQRLPRQAVLVAAGVEGSPWAVTRVEQSKLTNKICYLILED